MLAKGILGPYFKETVNQHNNLKMLQSFFWRRHDQTHRTTQNNIFQSQNGAYRKHCPKLAQGEFLKIFLDKKMWLQRLALTLYEII